MTPQANLVLKVDTGYYKSTKLDGAKVWVSTDLGSDWSTGKDSWVVMTFDPSDTPEQKAALSDILGQLYPFKWEKAATDTAAFSWNVDQTTGVAHAKMNNGKGEVALERVVGTNPNQEVVIPNLQYWQAQSNNGFRMWKTEKRKGIPDRVMNSETYKRNKWLFDHYYILWDSDPPPRRLAATAFHWSVGSMRDAKNVRGRSEDRPLLRFSQTLIRT